MPSQKKHPHSRTSKIILSLFLFIYIGQPVLWSQNAPVTTAGRVTNATPGNPSVPVPVTVTGFDNIGQFTLTLKFDTTRIRYVSATPSSSLTGMTVNYTPPSGSTQGKLVFTWTGASNTSLPDNSSIVNLVFQYVTGTGIMYWAYTFGTVCQYKRYQGGNLVLLNDQPKNEYYLNGGISNRTSPYAYAPAIASPVPGPVNMNILVNSFTTINSFSLYLEYDTTVITFLDTFSKNSAFTSNFLVGDNPASGSKKYIVIQWYGSTVSLADNSILCTLNFQYPQANCNAGGLNWFDNGASCEYTDNNGNVLIDMPQATFYANGIVATGLFPTWTGNNGNAWNDTLNWNACGVPVAGKDTYIPDVSPNPSPVVSSTAYCKSLTIQSGAALTISASGSLQVGN